jgi:hypothetical protein
MSATPSPDALDAPLRGSSGVRGATARQATENEVQALRMAMPGAAGIVGGWLAIGG